MQKHNVIGERQRQVLELVAQALSNKEIAYQLGLALSTVRMTTYLLYQRIGVQSRMEAADWARRHPEFMRAPAKPDVYMYPIGV